MENSLDSHKNQCKIIYFDLETSGFGRTDDILQIAAISDENEFDVYIRPTQRINKKASEVHNLSTNDKGELFLRGVKVDSINLYDALLNFSQFLKMQSEQCLLVAHNANFDKSRLINAISKNNLMEEFTTITGFSDTLTLLKKELPDRKGKGAYILSNLACEIIGENLNNTSFHEAMYDVKILQKIVGTLRKEEMLFDIKQSFCDAIEQVRINNKTSESGELKNTVSRDILKKLARANITLQDLKECFMNDGEEGIRTLLSKESDTTNKCLVTKDKNVLSKIIRYLKRGV